jgi:Mannanase, galactose-binding domain-like
MAKQPGNFSKFRSLGSIKGIVTLGVTLVLVVVMAWGVVSGTFGGVFAGNPAQTSNGALQLAPPVSPYLFGTNLGLFNSNDQVLTSTSTRAMLQQMHVRIIRMPMRTNLSEATEVQAAQAIKSMGAVPLVVLHGAVDATVQADDSRMVSDMNTVFGNSLVYYEYGNEEDLLGVDVTGYTASWNAVVPQLKHLALNGQFVGPVNFQYDRNYLTSFLQNANPRPDEVSWHEYTCDDSWASSICISHIANWTNHISDARAAMTSAIGTALPIMITEWNYAPNAVPNDGKNNNSAFMSTWTANALQTLAANGIFASMQYSVTNTAIPMVDSGNAITIQGSTFQNQYQTMITGGQRPTPVPTTQPGPPQPTTPSGSGNGSGGGVTPQPTQPVLTSQYSSFTFEDGSTDGWSGRGEVSQVQNSSSTSMAGKHSLQVTLTNMSNGDFPFVTCGGSYLSSYPSAGQTMTAYVYLPANSQDILAKLFVMDSQYHWFDPDNMVLLTPGTWNRLTFTLPTNVSPGQLRQLGVQFNTPDATLVSGNVYIDNVGWG